MESGNPAVTRLLQYKSRFLEIRQTFKLGEEVGFASIPEAHTHFSLGMSLPVTVQNDVWKYKINPAEPKEMIFSPKQRVHDIIVSPVIKTSTLYLVSIYQRAG